MKVKAVVPRQLAVRDAESAVDYYRAEASGEVALGFIQALRDGYGRISRHPESGSARYSYELAIPGLRCWPLGGYPHVIFYIEREDHIDVWRVLHGRRDIPASLAIP